MATEMYDVIRETRNEQVYRFVSPIYDVTYEITYDENTNQEAVVVIGNSQHEDDMNQEYTDMIENSLYEEQPTIKKLVSDKGLRCIKRVKFTQGLIDLVGYDVCPITQESFSDCNFISILPCNHGFETQAILKWLKTENACCPVCRHYLDFSDVLA